MPFINRKSFLGLAAVSFLQTKSSIANAASGPAVKPTRLGQTVIWRGRKYTAVKSGKKLVWNKGVVIPSPKPTPTPTLAAIADIDLAAANEVPEGETHLFYPTDPNARGLGFFVSRENGILNAFDTTCTHERCQVSIGVPQLICPCHLSIFNRVTGVVEGGPARRPLQNYPVTENSGRIVVTVTF